jgi:hypothetical protein
VSCGAIKEEREVAQGTLMVVFDLLGQQVDFRPGQYFWVTLLDPPYDDQKRATTANLLVTSSGEDRDERNPRLLDASGCLQALCRDRDKCPRVRDFVV